VRADRPLFGAGDLDAFEILERDLEDVQALFEACPGYFTMAMGEPAGPRAAREVFEGRPPMDMPYARKWPIGLRDRAGRLLVMADLVEDLLADGVWHIGLFVLPEDVHGKGIGRAAYGALEAWMRERGARWLRLGVIEGNVRAERFWQACGYVEVRKRASVAMGRRSNTVRVMVKPLTGGAVADYLALVERDR
jgi:GNAT superfamily N-acetyltransferase